MTIISNKPNRTRNVNRVLVKRRYRAISRKSLSKLKALDAVLRHPATLLLIGFVLTSILGAFLQNRQQAAENQRTMIADTHKAIDQIYSAEAIFVVRLKIAAANGEDKSLVPAARDALTVLEQTLISQRSAVMRPFYDHKDYIAPLQTGFQNLREFYENQILITEHPDKTTDSKVKLIDICTTIFLDSIREILALIFEDTKFDMQHIERMYFYSHVDLQNQAKACPRLNLFPSRVQ